jgi:hypothetical protein
MFPASILTRLQNGLRTPAFIDFWEQYKQWTPASNLEYKRRALAKDSKKNTELLGTLW